VTALAQQLLLGVLLGGLYGLAAAGLSLVFGVLRVLNVAHGELIMLGGYGAFWLFDLFGLDPFLSLLVVMPLAGALGGLLYAGLFAYVVRLGEEPRIRTSLLVGFGLALCLHALAVRLFTADERAITTTYVRRAYTLAFAIGTALAGAAGVLVATGYSVSPAIGLEWTLKALIVVVLAGLGSALGTFAGGVVLGCAEALSAALFGGAYREVVGLLLFFCVLVARPQGFFGRP